MGHFWRFKGRKPWSINGLWPTNGYDTWMELKSEREPGFQSRQPVLNSSLDSNHKCNVSFYLDVVTIVHYEKMQTTVVLQLPHLLCLQNPFLCFTVFCRSVVFCVFLSCMSMIITIHGLLTICI